MSKITIKNKNEINTFSFTAPLLISELLSKSGANFLMPCGAKGQCKKCKVKASGALSELSNDEEQFLNENEKENGIRFACMTTALGDCEIEILKEISNISILDEGKIKNEPLSALGEKYGIAVDIGTTTVVVSLYDLTSGKAIDRISKVNAQCVFGADIISRISHCINKGTGQITQIVRDELNSLIVSLCESNKIKTNVIDAAVIVGNTAMLYFLTGCDVREIAHAPFDVSNFFGRFFSAEEVGLKINKNAKIYLPKIISAYIGADITAGVLASEIIQKDECSILIDIGTNAEIVLFDGINFFCCSAAAGPALEGAGIHHGSPAIPGAIAHAKNEKGKFKFDTIENKKPIGICGSGIIEIISLMLELGIIDKNGTIQNKNHDYINYITEFQSKAAFNLPETDIIVSQDDIRAVQLAKSAVYTAIHILLSNAHLGSDDIEKFYIAGGFGNELDCTAAENIGTIPVNCAKKSEIIGNAAINGAIMMLLNKEKIKKCEDILSNTESIVLANEPIFFDSFINNMNF